MDMTKVHTYIYVSGNIWLYGFARNLNLFILHSIWILTIHAPWAIY